MADFVKGDVVVHTYQHNGPSPCNGTLGVVIKFERGGCRDMCFPSDDAVWVQCLFSRDYSYSDIYSSDTPWTAAAWEKVGHIDI